MGGAGGWKVAAAVGVSRDVGAGRGGRRRRSSARRGKVDAGPGVAHGVGSGRGKGTTRLYTLTARYGI